MIDDILKAWDFQDDCRAVGTGAEILTVAVIAAKFFQNHHERALCMLIRLGCVKGLSVSRFNRRLHQLRDWLYEIVNLLAEVCRQGTVFVMDSMPLPVCKRVRARRCKKVRGKAFCGYCAAKKEKFFGWRLHLICTASGISVSFDLLPASEQDLNPVHELTFALPRGATIFADRGYISEKDARSILIATGVRLVAIRRKNMAPLRWADDYGLRHYRRRIETVYSQLEVMGIQHLHARTHRGFDLKVHASILALTFTNLFVN